MTTDQISSLLTPFVGQSSLSESQLSSIAIYLELLLKWNSKLNLTAIRDAEAIVARHFGESLFAARQLLPGGHNVETAIDIGSGAGFPGLPLKIWDSSLQLALIESNKRKATFLREVVRALDIRDVLVLADRAEAVSACTRLVTLRAVERFEKILPVAKSLVASGGRLALLIGAAQVGAASDTLPDLSWKAPIAVPGSNNRVLLVGDRRCEPKGLSCRK